ncbi:hypothetical protein NL436_28135, partial [Klebsiella pneumoniae]|nr:hypothetical protein [Klebsiella pneumoniae]
MGLRSFLVLAPLFVACGCTTTESIAPDGSAPDPAVCTRDVECSDGLFCNGVERCEPTERDADALGCVPGTAPCPADIAC